MAAEEELEELEALMDERKSSLKEVD